MRIKVLDWHDFGGIIDSETWDGRMPMTKDFSGEFQAILAFNIITTEFVQFNGPKLFVSGEPLRHLNDFTRDMLCVLPDRCIWPYWRGSLEDRHFPYGIINEKSLETVAGIIQKEAKNVRPKRVCLINIRKPDHTKESDHDLQGLREEIALAIAQSGIIVNIYGRGNWEEFCEKSDKLKFHGEIPTKHTVLYEHDFTICLENTRFPGYITEKPYHALTTGTIPIYSGGWNQNSEYFEDGLILDPLEIEKEKIVDIVLNTKQEDLVERRLKIVKWLYESIQPRRSLTSRTSKRIIAKLEAQK